MLKFTNVLVAHRFEWNVLHSLVLLEIVRKVIAKSHVLLLKGVGHVLADEGFDFLIVFVPRRQHGSDGSFEIPAEHGFAHHDGSHGFIAPGQIDKGLIGLCAHHLQEGGDLLGSGNRTREATLGIPIRVSDALLHRGFDALTINGDAHEDG